YKEKRGLPKDNPDLEIMRQRLYGPTPLPAPMVKGELDFVRSCLPEHLRDNPQVRVAANGLYIVRTVFGHEDEGVRTYSGSYEQTPVPATFHAWRHTALGGRDGQLNMEAVNAQRLAKGLPPVFTNRRRLNGLSYFNHDTFMGHGRRAANPEAHDEKQSAELLVRHLEAEGLTDPEDLEENYAGVIVTTFNEKKKAQDIDPARGFIPVQENSAGSDFSGFRRWDGPKNSTRLVIEDFCRIGAGYDAPLTRLLEEINSNLPEGVPPVSIETDEDGFRLIDEHPDFIVTKAGDPPVQMTLQQAAAFHIRGSGEFCRRYKFAKHWVLGSAEQQTRNANFLTQLADTLDRGEITAVEALRRTKQYQQEGEEADRAANKAHSETQPNVTGSGSIGELKAAVEAIVSALPQEAAADITRTLDFLLESLANVAAGSANENLVGAQQLISGVKNDLAKARAAFAEAAQKLKGYNESL
ncbi:MAG TPA: hypothetical protein VMR45_05470, partial [Patescibacteria group bacterium]|nr:hypothetical protein [Patescibacteria group bacterium]